MGFSEFYSVPDGRTYKRATYVCVNFSPTRFSSTCKICAKFYSVSHTSDICRDFVLFLQRYFFIFKMLQGWQSWQSFTRVELLWGGSITNATTLSSYWNIFQLSEFVLWQPLFHVSISKDNEKSSFLQLNGIFPFDKTNSLCIYVNWQL